MGSSSVVRSSTTINSCAGVSVVCMVRGRVRKILGAVAVLPFADRQTTNVVALSQFPLRERRFADFVTDQMSGAGLAVKGLAHGAGSWVTEFNSVLKSNLALKNGRLRVGI